ncbi:MAG: hypothetical protein SGPRY_009801, partial [Prymnesium sp.]
VSDLKAELERQAGGRPPSDKQMRGLRDTHSKVMDAISTIQMREKGALQEQEKDLLRAFRARLWDVQFELENEKSKKDDADQMCTGALEWIEKTRTLGKELDWSREEARLSTPPSSRASSIPCRFPPSLHVSSCLLKALTPPQFLATPLPNLPAPPVPIAIPLALRLDRINQQLTRDNQRLKAQLRSQEDDREFIVRQPVTTSLSCDFVCLLILIDTPDHPALRFTMASHPEVLALKKENTRLKNMIHPEGVPNAAKAAAANLDPPASTAQGITPAIQISKSPNFASSLGADSEYGEGLQEAGGQESAPHPMPGGVNNVATAERVRELTGRLADTEERYREIVARLKRLLDVERSNLRRASGDGGPGEWGVGSWRS